MRIYVAGPYSADTEEGMQANTDNAIWAGVEIIQKGHEPYIPHLSHYMDRMAANNHIEISYDKWMDLQLTWLAMSDALFLLGHSPGADIELEFAQAIGMPIYYTIEEIPNGTF